MRRLVINSGAPPCRLCRRRRKSLIVGDTMRTRTRRWRQGKGKKRRLECHLIRMISAHPRDTLLCIFLASTLSVYTHTRVTQAKVFFCRATSAKKFERKRVVLARRGTSFEVKEEGFACVARATLWSLLLYIRYTCEKVRCAFDSLIRLLMHEVRDAEDESSIRDAWTLYTPIYIL